MALGGGTFLTHNKKLPGAYINFVSKAAASVELSDRGIAAIALDMDWCEEQKIFTVEQGDFIKNSLNIFGHAYGDDAMKPMREIFAHAKTVHFFRLNPASSGTKASNAFATAKYTGSRGNALKTRITANENTTQEDPLFDFYTYLGDVLVDEQYAIAEMTDLADTKWCTWNDEATIAVTAGTAFTGGANGTVVSGSHQAFLDQAESCNFNAMGCMSTDTAVKSLYAAYVERMRDEVGKKFQAVIFRQLADYEGVVSVKNGIAGTDTTPALIPWVTGVIAGTAVNRSAGNMKYDGEYDIAVDYTQSQLEAGLQEGSFMFHSVDGDVRVLSDINSFTTVTEGKNEDFSSNQTIRVLDQIANDIAVIFNTRYLGLVPNDESGRISLWNTIVRHHEQMEKIHAIEDFSGDDVTVEKGETRTAVLVSDCVCPTGAMEKLYMTVYVQ